MRTRSPFVVALALPLAAQGYVPDPIRSTAPAAALSQSHGLEPRADGLGLRGGGADYRVQFDERGMRFEPALGGAVATTQHLALQPLAVMAGGEAALAVAVAAPAVVGSAAHYAHVPGITERYEVRPDGVALSWRFDERPASPGDLVVRYAVDTSLPTPVPHADGVAFRRDDSGGVAIGGVTGIDADGNTAAGSVRCANGVLELRLPGAFVAEAAFPLVLDPIIGTVFSVSVGLTYDDDEPDVAYDHVTTNWLVVWRRRFSATNVEIRGQRVSSIGNLVGGTIFFSSSGVATRPRVAISNTLSIFGVAWIQQVTGTVTVSQVAFETVTGSGGTLANALILATSASQVYEDVDVGSQAEALLGLPAGFVVVYRAPGQGAIRARRLTLSFPGTVTQSPEFPILTDVPLGVTYSQPAVARSTRDGNLLVVARRASVLTSGRAIAAAVVHTYDNAIGPTLTFATSSSDDASSPDVDGQGGRWVVAWDRQGSGGTWDQVRVAPVALDAAGTALSAGAVTTFGGTALSLAQTPSVGWSPARTWIGYQGKSTLPTVVTTLRVAAVDSASCTICNDTWGVQVFNDERRIAVAPQVGGPVTEEDSLAVYGAGPALDVYAQRLRHYGTTGSTAGLGGSCGTPLPRGGLSGHPLVIGTFWHQGVLTEPTAVAAIFNLAAPTAPIPCGPCVWTPFEITAVALASGGAASVQFVIPCLPTLVGAPFESQWTVLDPSASPCTMLPGISLSERFLHTVGQ